MTSNTMLLGFQALSKVEIKKDTKEIEKNATYAVNLFE